MNLKSVEKSTKLYRHWSHRMEKVGENLQLDFLSKQPDLQVDHPSKQEIINIIRRTYTRPRGLKLNVGNGQDII